MKLLDNEERPPALPDGRSQDHRRQTLTEANVSSLKVIASATTLTFPHAKLVTKLRDEAIGYQRAIDIFIDLIDYSEVDRVLLNHAARECTKAAAAFRLIARRLKAEYDLQLAVDRNNRLFRP